MHWRLIVVTLILGAATLAVPTVTASASWEDAAHAQQLRLSGCEQQIGVFPMADDVVTPLLPEGFEPIAFQDSSPAGPTGAPPPPGAEATLQLTVTTCAITRGAHASTRPVVLAQAWSYVTPPESLRDDAGRLGPTPSPYLAVLWVGASDAAVSGRLRAWGLPAETAEVTNVLDRLTGCPAGSPLPCIPAENVRVGRADVTGVAGAWTLDTLVPVLARETTPEHLRLFGVEDRSVTGIVDFVEQPHTHLMLGSATLQHHGTIPFPAPEQPGVSLHVEPGYELALVPVRPGGRGSDGR